MVTVFFAPNGVDTAHHVNESHIPNFVDADVAHHGQILQVERGAIWMSVLPGEIVNLGGLGKSKGLGLLGVLGKAGIGESGP